MTAPLIALTGVPVLTTERLVLRAPEALDFDAFADYAASERSRFTGGPQARDLAWRGFCGVAGHWAIRGYAFFVMEHRETGRAVGMAGPWFPEGWPEPEIGWQLWDPGFEGQGLAHEAALETRRFAYDTLGWSTAISLIAPENARSAALARRIGCRYDRAFTHERYGACDIWRHPAPGKSASGVAA